MIQTDLFAEPVQRRCGTCVHRNAVNEAQPYGDCTPVGPRRPADGEPCAYWFGLTQLRTPLYGRRAA